MKKLKLFCPLLFPLFFNAQSFVTQWSKTFGGDMDEAPREMIRDSNGDLVFAGYYQSALSVPNASWTQNLPDDMFIIKTDANGNIIWGRNAVGNINGLSVSVDGADNIYCTGNFSGTVAVGTASLASAGTASEYFIFKFDPSGNLLMSIASTHTALQRGERIAADMHGNYYLAGVFTNTLSFGSHSVSSAGQQDWFLARFNSSNQAVWAKSGGTTGNDVPTSLYVDNGGNVLLGGVFFEQSLGDSSFVIKYDSSGNVMWQQDLFHGRPIDIASDAADNYYVTGYCWQDVMFDTVSLSQSGGSMYIAKFTSSGKCTWAKNYRMDFGNAVAVLSNGHPVVTAPFSYTSVAVAGNTYTNAGQMSTTDAMLIEFDPSGNVITSLRIGGTGNDEISALAADGLHFIAAGGYDSGTLSVGPVSHTNAGGYDCLWFRAGSSSVDIAAAAVQKTGNIFPNPASPGAAIRFTGWVGYTGFELRDVAGHRVLARDFRRPGTEEEAVLPDSLAPGIYFVTFTGSSAQPVSKKLVIGN